MSNNEIILILPTALFLGKTLCFHGKWRNRDKTLMMDYVAVFLSIVQARDHLIIATGLANPPITIVNTIRVFRVARS